MNVVVLLSLFLFLFWILTSLLILILGTFQSMFCIYLFNWHWLLLMTFTQNSNMTFLVWASIFLYFWKYVIHNFLFFPPDFACLYICQVSFLTVHSLVPSHSPSRQSGDFSATISYMFVVPYIWLHDAYLSGICNIWKVRVCTDQNFQWCNWFWFLLLFVCMLKITLCLWFSLPSFFMFILLISNPLRPIVVSFSIQKDSLDFLTILLFIFSRDIFHVMECVHLQQCLHLLPLLYIIQKNARLFF